MSRADVDERFGMPKTFQATSTTGGSFSTEALLGSNGFGLDAFVMAGETIDG